VETALDPITSPIPAPRGAASVFRLWRHYRKSRRHLSSFRHREGQQHDRLVVPAGGGKHLDVTTPGRSAALTLLGHETNESIMLFEETVPAGTASLFHLHRGSDEVGWVLAGEITFQIGDEVKVGGPGACAFFPRNVPHAWTPAASCFSTPRPPPAVCSGDRP